MDYYRCFTSFTIFSRSCVVAPVSWQKRTSQATGRSLLTTLLTITSVVESVHDCRLVSKNVAGLRSSIRTGHSLQLCGRPQDEAHTASRVELLARGKVGVSHSEAPSRLRASVFIGAHFDAASDGDGVGRATLPTKLLHRKLASGSACCIGPEAARPESPAAPAPRCAPGPDSPDRWRETRTRTQAC